VAPALAENGLLGPLALVSLAPLGSQGVTVGFFWSGASFRLFSEFKNRKNEKDDVLLMTGITAQVDVQSCTWKPLPTTPAPPAVVVISRVSQLAGTWLSLRKGLKRNCRTFAVLEVFVEGAQASYTIFFTQHALPQKFSWKPENNSITAQNLTAHDL
jgi:hypothetical protein